ncbi:Gfo/Idh/MocA family oxidoreductase [Hoyosella altamirensis]|uniref:Myo-inositol 2-dehydrogenase/D-chiro-inositol 1-dehydrogenase n=1 Tax=Hoyosella altamirensis TaxID=616997 RepID=A0A839RV15_9ACTN|nr:Gfo/Idh/MocA family oxidoreductase [Hoyosella altamirensis]MBB3039723.1 myo-inositol 2-dehydrogenase/D-chiro-inositol 1-dehydrogenase [Hoyosella altamirensis]
MSKKTAIALAGLGRMGRIHLTNLAGRCPSAQLAAVFDVREDVAREVGELYGVPWTTRYDDLLENPDLDAIAIATPTGTHAPLTIAAARAGKHVFSEKPISLDRGATVDVLDAVKRAGIQFQVGFHRRFDPDWVAGVERIQNGELGEVFMFRTSLRDMIAPKAEFLAGSGGFFVDVTIHDLDTARWIAGEIVEVSAHGSSLSDPAGFAAIGDVDTAVVIVRFENGALGIIDNSRAAGYGYECSTEVVGSKATLRIDNPRRYGYEWRTPGTASVPLVEDFEQRYPYAYQAELEAFAQCVQSGEQPRCTGLDALAAFDIAQAAARAWKTGATVKLNPQHVEGGTEYGPLG